MEGKQYGRPKVDACVLRRKAPNPELHIEVAVSHKEDFCKKTMGGNYTLKKIGKLSKKRDFGRQTYFFNWLGEMRRTELGSGIGVSKKRPWKFTTTQGERKAIGVPSFTTKLVMNQLTFLHYW